MTDDARPKDCERGMMWAFPRCDTSRSGGNIYRASQKRVHAVTADLGQVKSFFTMVLRVISFLVGVRLFLNLPNPRRSADRREGRV